MGTNIGGQKIRCADGKVRTLVDATYSINVVIAEADNANAVCGSPGRCAVAQAIIRYFASRGQEIVPSVGADKAFIQMGGKIMRWQLPPNVRALIRTFDGIGVFPTGYSVQLVPVAPSERLGARSKSRGFKDRSKPTAGTPALRSLPTRHVASPKKISTGG